MTVDNILLRDFNLKALASLDFIDHRLKHLAVGTGGKHPNLRLEWLRYIKLDIEFIGVEATIEKWRNFTGNGN